MVELWQWPTSAKCSLWSRFQCLLFVFVCVGRHVPWCVSEDNSACGDLSSSLCCDRASFCSILKPGFLALSIKGMGLCFPSPLMMPEVTTLCSCFTWVPGASGLWAISWFLFFFWDTVSLCSSGWPRTYYVAKHEGNSPASAASELCPAGSCLN